MKFHHKTIKKFFNLIIKTVFPRTCFICNQIISEGYFCAEDWSKIHFLQKPACNICFQPFKFATNDQMLCASCIKKPPIYNKAISVIKYDQSSKKLITKFKYGDQTYISKYFSSLMYKNAHDIIYDIDFITPVPLSKLKMIRRKFNQSALIAQNFAKISNKKIIFDLLIKTRNTKAQAQLNKKLRSKNIFGSFSCNEKYRQMIFNKNILLIDDVITTGSTINACSKILKQFGVNKIYVLTLAKTVLD